MIQLIIDMSNSPNNKTAMMQLFDLMNQEPYKTYEEQYWLDKIESLLQIEKQQIITAYEMGDKYKLEISGEHYYNEAYGND